MGQAVMPEGDPDKLFGQVVMHSIVGKSCVIDASSTYTIYRVLDNVYSIHHLVGDLDATPADAAKIASSISMTRPDCHKFKVLGSTPVGKGEDVWSWVTTVLAEV